ncbi:DHH family phosphoesterase [Pseudoflavonifractor phocaeensis]|uniref:DHH family phosphoesterase n=1 Tax=Pseudoflavonifractor phocaeensis TaxID=1870988 RepID=UPI00195C2501|nr:DHH family phosphoesterase [Pseudoflavonifractor phocaeensis]MBM6926161.1 DHH family phosphoesterase [Pseudoflavonifractor phocaeensis]
MRKNKLSYLMEPSLRLYFVCLVVFAGVTALFSIPAAVAEIAVVALLYLYFRRSNAVRQKEILKYIESVTCNMDTATKDTMVNAPLPMVIFRPENDEVIWSNDRFLQITGEREHLFDTKLSVAVPDFNSRWLMEGKTECPHEILVGERRFQVFGHLVRTAEQGVRGYLATTYWVDITDLASVRDEFYASRPVVAILTVDNYEEVMKGMSDNAKSAIRSEIDDRLAQWVAPAQGVFCRYERDRYLFLFEERYLAQFQEGKFSILDTVRQVTNSSGIQATLSIGIGRDGDTLGDLFQYAALSVEMALSRGGDQVVIKNRINFEFYGGRTKELEKRTKVKSRVMANALGELMADASMVFVMGHKFPDLDCIGAAAGVCAMARKKGAPVHIVREPGVNPASEMCDRLAAVPEYKDVFLSPQDAILLADSNCLLVVVDTNRPEQVVSQDLLEAVHKVAVIDHHRRASSYIADAALNFHEPYASSASELSTELLQYLLEPADLLKIEAEALLAGIALDTKQFTMRTGSRTFEAAAFLRRSGADTGDVKKLFQNDLEGTIAKYDIIQTARLYKEGIAVARVDHTVGRITAAQAADELLNISGIDTSFVLFPDQEGRVILSARSMGDVNVQVVLEKLGGGGNAATAGAQVPGKTVDEVTKLLLQAIDQYLENE